MNFALDLDKRTVCNFLFHLILPLTFFVLAVSFPSWILSYSHCGDCLFFL